VLSVDRQEYDEAGAVWLLLFSTDRAAVGFDDAASDSQPQARTAAPARSINLIKALEDQFAFTVRYARTFVGNPELKRRPIDEFGGAYLYRSVAGCVAERVSNQIIQHARELLRVEAHGGYGARDSDYTSVWRFRPKPSRR